MEIRQYLNDNFRKNPRKEREGEGERNNNNNK